ncbi:MAG TPA: phytoene/squalene synthase family protein [Ramlibacter sp.]|nr:phytoene/squalene synthase family protein [Ramlibacter sp.]
MSPSARQAPDLMTLLRGVSRSFYLSIRLLPDGLARPIAVAYLLARATDTVADTAELPAQQRLAMLQALAGVIDDRAPRAGLDALILAFAPLQQDVAERQLVEALPLCMAWLAGLDAADQADVRTVLRHITRGQSLDVQRFGQASGVNALPSAADLDEYTWLVAGSVGEFWTDLCARHLPGFARLPLSTMRELGRAYGMGLQLVNILRDTGADLAQGRCYFPADELAAAGLRPEGIAGDPGHFAAVRGPWLAKARGGLAAGMRYADAVNSRRVRAGTALPALLGARTLALVEASGEQGLRGKVKVPRNEVRSVLARVALTLAGRASLQAQFARLGK